MKKKTHLLLEEFSEMSNIKAIQTVLEIMKNNILKSGIHPKTYEYIEKRLPKLNENELNIAKVYFLDLYVNEYEQLRKAWNNLPDHAWKNWEIMFNDHTPPERAYLTQCIKIFKGRWNERPIKKKRKKKKNIKTDNSEGAV